jgi:hypothetical protein
VFGELDYLYVQLIIWSWMAPILLLYLVHQKMAPLIVPRLSKKSRQWLSTLTDDKKYAAFLGNVVQQL